MKYVVVCAATGWRSKPYPTRETAEARVAALARFGPCECDHEVVEDAVVFRGVTVDGRPVTHDDVNAPGDVTVVIEEDARWAETWQPEYPEPRSVLDLPDEGVGL